MLRMHDISVKYSYTTVRSNITNKKTQKEIRDHNLHELLYEKVFV